MSWTPREEHSQEECSEQQTYRHNSVQVVLQGAGLAVRAAQVVVDRFEAVEHTRAVRALWAPQGPRVQHIEDEQAEERERAAHNEEQALDMERFVELQT